MTGEPGDPDAVLREFAALRVVVGDPQLEAVTAAIFLEDTFGITLSDAEIDPNTLGDVAGLRAVVRRHLSSS